MGNESDALHSALARDGQPSHCQQAQSEQEGSSPCIPSGTSVQPVLSTTLERGGGGKKVHGHPSDAERSRPPVVVHRLSDFVRRVPEELPWIWSGYVARGLLTLLAGRPKVGKSTLVYAGLPHIAGGKLFLERKTAPTRAILLSEEHPYAVAEKTRRFGIAEGARIVSRAETYSIPWPQLVSDIAKECREQGIGLVVIDTIAEWAGLRGDDENQAGAIHEALKPLKQAAGEFDLAFVLVAHQRKSGGELGDAVRGSSALTAGVDIVVELERATNQFGEYGRVLRSQSRFGGTPREFVIELGEDGYSALAGSADDAVKEQQRRRLLDVLDRHAEATMKQLEKETDIPPSTAGRRMRELEEAGRVEVFGKGHKGDPRKWRRCADDRESVRTSVERSELHNAA